MRYLVWLVAAILGVLIGLLITSDWWHKHVYRIK